MVITSELIEQLKDACKKVGGVWNYSSKECIINDVHITPISKSVFGQKFAVYWNEERNPAIYLRDLGKIEVKRTGDDSRIMSFYGNHAITSVCNIFNFGNKHTRVACGSGNISIERK